MSVIALILAQGAASGPPAAVTWNPSDKSANITLSGSNLIATKTGGGETYGSLRATLGHDATDAGGFYYEAVITTGTTSPFIIIGIANTSQVLNNFVGSGANGWAYYEETGEKYHSGSGSTYGASYTTGDVIGILLKNGKVYFRKNGTWQNGADVDAETGEAFSGLTGILYPAASLYRASAPSHVITGRFKSADFSGSIPTGAAAWES